MKVKYIFNLDNEESNDKFNLKLAQNAFDMYLALDAISNIRRNLEKGYVYYKGDEGEDTYTIESDKLIDDLSDILSNSKYWDVQEC